MSALRKDTTTLSDIRSMLRRVEEKIPSTVCRIVPTSFNPKDPTLGALPRPLNWRWESCERALRHFNPKTVMSRIPLFWQIETLLHNACKTVGAPIYINDQENMPVGAAAIRFADVNTVILEADDSFAFSAHLVEKGVSIPPYWVVIHRADGAWETPRTLQSASSVAQEVHLFPGVPILWQCEELMRVMLPQFHLSDEYNWKVESETYITSAREDPLPFTLLRMPFSLRKEKICSCGKDIFAKRV